MPRQRGAATLIVVMVLFFVISLVAAYASRNMIFEQRTSANQYRATQAFEAADGGLEWALTQLNGGRLNDDCTQADPALSTPPVAVTNPSFRQRYLNLDPVTGIYTETLSSRADRQLPTCVYNGSGWNCTCPAGASTASPSATPSPGYVGPQPAFRVRMRWVLPPLPAPAVSPPPPSRRPGIIRIESAGCTRLSTVATDACLNFSFGNSTGDGVDVVTMLAALRSALSTPPTAPLTVRGNLTRSPVGAFIDLTNGDIKTNGIALQTGTALSADARASVRAVSLPGTPGAASVVENDGTLAGLTAADRMFVAVFGMPRSTYRQQPGLRQCPAPCNSGAVNAMLANHPNRPIWVTGNLIVDGDIGVDSDPALLIVSGAINVDAVAATLKGAVYLDTTGTATVNLSAGGSLTMQGALVADNDLAINGDGTIAINYNTAVLSLLRTGYGSFVRLPGSWRDWNIRE